jgi:NADPH:quinone reductase-like Zn-dependent oxidoreductase
VGFGGPEVLEIVDLPDPHPGPGQVPIAVRAAGVNPSDWKKAHRVSEDGHVRGKLVLLVG